MGNVADHEMEAQLLGALIDFPSWLADAREAGITPEAFDAPPHRAIFDAMQAVPDWEAIPEDEAGLPLKTALLSAGNLDGAVVRALANARELASPSRPNVTWAAASLRALADQRAAAQRSQEEKAQARRIAHLDESAPQVGAFLADALQLMQARADGTAIPVETPWPEINRALRGGLWPGLYALTGSTGSGKSQWTMQTALAAARRGTPVLYVGLELGPVDLVARLLGLMIAESDPRTGVLWSDLFFGEKSEALQRAIDQHAAELATLPLRLEVAPPFGWTASMLTERVRVLREQYPAPAPLLVVLDYLQLVAPERDAGRQDLRERIGAAAYAGRAAARLYGASVVAVSSVSRENAKRLVDGAGTAAPSEMVGLGKESGEIEFAADAVLALGRGEAFGGQTEIHLAIAKLRGGSASWQQLYFNGGWFAEQPSPEFMRARNAADQTAAAEPKGRRQIAAGPFTHAAYMLPEDAV